MGETKNESGLKPGSDEFIQAVFGMASAIPFFPQDEVSHRVIALALGQFISTREQLDWLILQAVSHIRDWSKAGGVPELRGIFCRRFEPADGIWTYATTPGFTLRDSEAAYIEREAKETERKLAQWKREAELEGREPAKFPLPDVKKLQ